MSVDELIADPTIDVILNLTPPLVHAAVTMQALAVGKHVYTEKPLATDSAEATALACEADRLGLRIGCAPDIFLGSAYQAGRSAIDEGAIGEPLSVSAAMLVGGQETWHPNPDIFYTDGAGPLFDMGPYYLTAIVALLGPIERVAGFASMRPFERTIEIGPRRGESFTATTPTHTSATMQLGGGATANLIASFEARDQYICDVAIYGTRGRPAAARSQRVRRVGPAQAGAGWLGGRAVRLSRRRRRPRHRPPRHGRGHLGGPAASRVRRARGPHRRRRAGHPALRGRGADRRDLLERRAAGAAARDQPGLRGRGGVARGAAGHASSTPHEKRT